MPSIAGFIQSLLSEDIYATGMIEEMDERIADLNNGQLRLMVRYCETKVNELTSKTVLDAYAKLLRKARSETDKRHEEEMRGERERLRMLKAAHAGVNAKAWDTSHASLDRELVKFQKFLKAKARRVAEEEVLQEEMEKLHTSLLAVPARRVTADERRWAFWAAAGALMVVIAPILVLCLLPLGVWPAVGSYGASLVLALGCWFVGVLRGTVIVPTLDDDVIEDRTRQRAKERLKGYRAEVRENYEEFEQAFAADMKWRDDWAEAKKRERRARRRDKAARLASDISHAQAEGHTGTDEDEEKGVVSTKAVSTASALAAREAARSDGNETRADDLARGGKLPVDDELVGKRGGSEPPGSTRGPCQGANLVANPPRPKQPPALPEGHAHRSS